MASESRVTDSTTTTATTTGANAAAENPIAPTQQQRDGQRSPYLDVDVSKVASADEMAVEGDTEVQRTTSGGGRRMSREWDASKVPPSQFQKRKGSIYSTPSSRDGLVHGAGERDKAYFDKLKEKGWHGQKGTGSK